VLAVLILGAVLGYVAASVGTISNCQADNARSAPGVQTPSVDTASSSQGATRSPMLAMTTSDEKAPEILLAQANQKGSSSSSSDGKKPNIVFIMGDDVGWFNIGAYHQGIMAGRTPNLDKLAAEGMRFTDYYAEASCTAGRANFITGELPIRTGSISGFTLSRSVIISRAPLYPRPYTCSLLPVTKSYLDVENRSTTRWTAF
jgi:Sulfatase